MTKKKALSLSRRITVGLVIAVGISLALLALEDIRPFAAVGLGCTFGLVFALVTDGR